MKNKLISKR